MKKIYLLTLLLLSMLPAIGQQYHEDLDLYHFCIINDTDSIDFIKLGKSLDTTKPSIIFCQGSLPIPLLIETKEGVTFLATLNNFDFKKIAEDYNLIEISMPYTPLKVREENLNNQYAYITEIGNQSSYSSQYLEANYLEKYIERGNAVVDYLTEQKWVDKNKIYIVGHSQGAKVATKIASQNQHIAGLGFLSGNPLGRIDQYIREYRIQEMNNELSAEEAQNKIEETYEWWQWLCENRDNLSKDGDDNPRTTISFSQSILSDLLKLTIPVFIGYGTRDIVSSYCDLLPIDFIRVGKTNYKHKPYVGLNHNFMKVDSEGRGIKDKFYWSDVMSDFVSWLNTLDSNKK